MARTFSTQADKEDWEADARCSKKEVFNKVSDPAYIGFSSESGGVR